MMNDKFEKLRLIYLKSLESYRGKLKTLLALCSDDSAAIKQLGQIGHKLAGSGAIYGYDEVSESGRLLEQVCRHDAHMQMSPEVATQRLIDSIEQAIQQKNDRDLVGCFSEYHDLSSARLLIIEDDSMQAKLIRAWLEDSGAEIQVGSSLGEARNLLSKQSFDFILCGLELSDEHWSAVKFLRAEQNHNATIIIMTSHGSFDARLAAVRAGAQGFMQKPFTAEQLVGMISRFQADSGIQDKAVLIVEDDDIQAQLYKEVLKTVGVAVHEAADPRRGYEILVRESIDLVITDVNLPICSGIEFGRLVRHNPKFNHIPILFMSTDTSTDTKLSALEVAAEEFVTKPIEPWRLAVLVESRLRKLAARV